MFFPDISFNNILKITLNDNLSLIAVYVKVTTLQYSIHVYTYSYNTPLKKYTISDFNSDINTVAFSNILGEEYIIIADTNHIYICNQTKYYKKKIWGNGSNIQTMVANDQFIIIGHTDSVVRVYEIINEVNCNYSQSFGIISGYNEWEIPNYKIGFGYTLATDKSGSYIFVGTKGAAMKMQLSTSPEHHDSYCIDTVNIYKLDANEYQLVQTIPSPSPNYTSVNIPYSLFGYSLSYKNNILAISAPYYSVSYTHLTLPTNREV